MTTQWRKKQPPPAEGVAQPLQVPRAALAPDPDQPRQTGVHEGLGPLTDSIKARGIIQPILVRPHPDPAARAATPYMIVVGERRWAAAGRAGLDEVPVFLLDRQLDSTELLMLQLDENEGDNRLELPLYDRARAVARALAIEGGSQAKFALRHRKSTAWVSYFLSLARAEGPLGEALREGRLRSQMAARGFQRLTPEDQRELLAWARQHDVAITLPATEKIASRRERRTRAAAQAGDAAGGAAPQASSTDAAAVPATPAPAAGTPASPATPAGGYATPACPPTPAPISLPATAPRAVAGVSAEPSARARQRIGSHEHLSAPPTAASPPELDRATRLDAGTALLSADSAPGPTAPSATASPGAASATATPDRPAGILAEPASPPLPPPPALLAATASARPDRAVSGTPGAPVLRYRAIAQPSSAPAPAPRLDVHPSAAPPPDVTVPPQPADTATPVLSSVPAPAPAPAARSAAAGLLAAASRGAAAPPPFRPAAGPDDAPGALHDAAGLVKIQLTFTQLQQLIRLLGHEPATTPRALVDQLLSLL
jgi:ParB/RepB/Spo0J family partition protein